MAKCPYLKGEVFYIADSKNSLDYRKSGIASQGNLGDNSAASGIGL
jgi:hypothetical protein